MIRNLFLICGALLFGIIAFCALGPSQPRADFTYVNPSGIHTLDPARMSWTQDFRVALNVWEGLTTWHAETTEPIGAAAVWPPEVSADGRTYTFTIRPDARWSNGDPVTAGDFVRGWRRGMEPGTATDYTFFFTQHLAGAAQYVQWRNEAVRILPALKRLADGWGITADQARAVAGHHALDQPGGALMGEQQVPAVDAEDAAWRRFAADLHTTQIDWQAVYDAVFQAHVDEFEARFEAVGLRTPDERTLILELTRPCPYLLDLTAMPIFLPCHESIERLRKRHRGAPITAEGLVVYDPQWTKPDYHRHGYPGLITNGAYRLSEWTFKRRIRLAVNPHYRDADEIAFRTVDMLVYDNIHAAIMAYEAGDVDFLPAMDVSYDHEIARLARSGERPDFHLCPALATYFFNFNCLSDKVAGNTNPFVDRRVRKAFCLAVDKHKIVDNVLKRGDRVAGSFVPSGAIAGYQPPEGLSLDVSQARSLLAQAGYPGGAGLPPIELLCTPRDTRVCQALARMWEESLGARIELRSQESKAFAENKANRRYMIARGNWYADYNDPTTFLDCLATGNGNNDSGYSNPTYDALLVQANSTDDPTRRAELLAEAEALIVEQDLPILPILHYSVPIAIKPYIHGLYANPRLWFPFKSATLGP